MAKADQSGLWPRSASDAGRFIVHTDQELPAFPERESAIQTHRHMMLWIVKGEARWTLNYHLSTSNYLTSAHVDGRRLNPMVNQRSANVAATTIKAMPTIAETADANG